MSNESVVAEIQRGQAIQSPKRGPAYASVKGLEWEMGRFWVIVPLLAVSMSGCGWVEVPAPPGAGSASRTAAPLVRFGPVTQPPSVARSRPVTRTSPAVAAATLVQYLRSQYNAAITGS